ncbi:glucan phosphoethanolaminetransferase (alkaline phosphatase superfamily) [Bacillus ectoiniformans]|uniref:DUF2768 domain-containing protein n=1 Tax=Bacillus ectoiniformans TaxID=1494429 RepID=UPI00195E1451|nr:DUF2768 domain-containing protein [Bacillus ectoiniformans]MBM7648002.1 glucan phosphoethanolaminetransferase (alkaline phosphatase superfamily) [Bacillus ectoiniformans]
MSPAMLKMWVSLIGMGLMFVAIVAIYISRYKVKHGFIRAITAIIAYLCMIVGGIIMVYVVFSGPTGV